MKFKSYLFVIFFVSIFLLTGTRQVSAACYNSTQDNLPNGLVDGDIDHYDIECFDEIPDSWISSASQLHLLFVDRSVGGNIHVGLNCLAAGTPYSSANPSCKSRLTQADYVSDTKYNRSNWDFAHYDDGGWYDNVENFILNQNLRSADGSSWSPNYPSYDVMNFQFSYLSVMQGSGIDGINGYFVPYPGDTNRIRDIHDMEAFESDWPSINFPQATSSLARSIGGETSYNFNNQMRAYSNNSGHFLIDFADIGSHGLDGNECLDASGYPILCEEYTSEVIGGHLAYGMSMQLMAKAVWLTMAGIAGWVPGNTNTPPPTTPPTQTPQPTAISTPTVVPTDTPTATPGVPGDADSNGVVDGLDYVIWLNNYGNNVFGAEFGDFDNSGNVDGIDYIIWLNNYS